MIAQCNCGFHPILDERQDRYPALTCALIFDVCERQPILRSERAVPMTKNEDIRIRRFDGRETCFDWDLITAPEILHPDDFVPWDETIAHGSALF